MKLHSSRSASSNNFRDIDGQSNIVIENQVFQGGGTGNNDYGIYINNSSNITIRNCVFRDYAGTGHSAIFVTGGSNQITIERCIFSYCTTGVRFNGNDDMTLLHVKNNYCADLVGHRPAGLTSFCQLVGVKRTQNGRINDNQIRFYFNSQRHDNINFFGSGGVSSDYLECSRNTFKSIITSVNGNGEVTMDDIGGNEHELGGADIVIGDDGGQFMRIEDNDSSNGSQYGYQVVDENNAANNYPAGNIIFNRNRCYMDKYKSTFTDYRTNEVRIVESSLGLQIAGGNTYCEEMNNNLIYAWRINNTDTAFIRNSVFRSDHPCWVNGTGNLRDDAALNAGCTRDMVPDNFIWKRKLVS